MIIEEEFVRLPYIGERARELEKSLPNARPDKNDSLLAPLVVPKLPSRFYYLFQKVRALQLEYFYIRHFIMSTHVAL